MMTRLSGPLESLSSFFGQRKKEGKIALLSLFQVREGNEKRPKNSTFKPRIMYENPGGPRPPAADARGIT